MALLPTLPEAALKRVAKQALALTGTAATVPVEPASESETQLVYDCLIDAIKLGGTISDPPDYGTFRRMHKRHVPLLEKYAAGLEKFSKSKFGAQTKPERQKVYTLCGKILKSHLRANYESVGIVSMINTLPRLPDAIDEAFPGYMDNGMLEKLL